LDSLACVISASAESALNVVSIEFVIDEVEASLISGSMSCGVLEFYIFLHDHSIQKIFLA